MSDASPIHFMSLLVSFLSFHLMTRTSFIRIKLTISLQVITVRVKEMLKVVDKGAIQGVREERGLQELGYLHQLHSHWHWEDFDF